MFLSHSKPSVIAHCKDDTPMVRRAAAKNIFAVFAVCEEEHVGLFVAQYEEFMTSDDVLLSVDSHCRKQSN